MKRRALMIVTILAGVLSVWMVGFVAPAATEPAKSGELALLKPFLGGTDGWDYLTVDPAARRVYVARSTRVMVFDADKGTVVGEVADTPGVHGIALVSDLNLGFATCGKDGTVVAFDLKTLKGVGKIKTGGQRPDAILYDEASKRIYAFNHGSGDIAIIDPAALDKPAQMLAVGGTLEYGATDNAGHVYVNVEDKSEVVAIDSKQQKVIAHWPVAPGEEPTGLAMDVEHRRLFVGCGNKTMAILDADSGKVLGTVPVGSGVDGVAFDAKLGLAMSANGRDGTVTVVREGPPGEFSVVQTLTTYKGARTIADDPKTQRAFLPCMIPGENGRIGFGLAVVGRPD